MSTHPLRAARRLRVSIPALTLASLGLAIVAPRAASAVQSAEIYRTDPYFYGRFEARLRFAPGEGVVSSFFLWKDGSSSTTSWNELDYEKINSTCRLQTNIWTGKGTQSAQFDTTTPNICGEYHTYAFEWTPDYIAWIIDGTQVRKVHAERVAGHGHPFQRLGRKFQFRRHSGSVDAARAGVHQLGPVLVVCEW
jgi:hypothetical protein